MQQLKSSVDNLGRAVQKEGFILFDRPKCQLQPFADCHPTIVFECFFAEHGGIAGQRSKGARGPRSRGETSYSAFFRTHGSGFLIMLTSMAIITSYSRNNGLAVLASRYSHSTANCSHT